MVTIEEFRKTATPKQIEVIDRLVELHKDGLAARADFQDVQDEIDRRCSLVRQSCGLQSYLIDDELELFVDPLLPVRTECADEYREISKEMVQLFKRAIELNMEQLGYIQRNYKKITGEPIPRAA